MKLLFVDLDDTLLNSDKAIDKPNLDAIEEMVSRGNKVIITSGRPFLSVKKLAEKYGFLREGFYIACFNGGSIYDANTLEKLAENTITVEETRYLFDKAMAAGLHCHTYTETNVVSERDTEALKYYTSRIKMEGIVVDDFRNVVSKPPKMIVICLEGRKKLEAFREEVKHFTDGKLYVTFSNDDLLEFASPLANKGEAVRFMCDYLGVPIENAVAAGDEENDLPMIEAAGVGCAMINGKENVKAKADYVTEHSNDENAIKEIIYRFIL